MRRLYLSRQQKALLTRSVPGICIRGTWLWVLDGEPVTAAINGALKKGWIEADYYTGGHAATRPTAAGRFAIHLDAAQSEQGTLNSALALARAKELAEKEKTA